jgi:dTDP-4-dehydrorhamnose reductase
MKTVVLGSRGQLGRDLCPRLPGEVLGWTRDEGNLAKPETLVSGLDAVRPDVVINCAAYNLVDRAETDRETAFAVNAHGVEELARTCARLGCLLVHFSTDYVFGQDQERRTPWKETDPPGPVSVYGESKLAGEESVRQHAPQHLVLRTCGLYGIWGSGGKGTNFVETMLGVAGQGKPLRVVADQLCTPSYTVDVAEAVIELLRMGARGTYHVTNAGSCSWYQLAQAIFLQAGVMADLTPITSQEYNAPARRPAYSILDCTKLATQGVSQLRHWSDALGDYLQARKLRLDR